MRSLAEYAGRHTKVKPTETRGTAIRTVIGK
jgi:hypothetical protein